MYKYLHFKMSNKRELCFHLFDVEKKSKKQNLRKLSGKDQFITE